jgi:biotin carboxyl carrier protein
LTAHRRPVRVTDRDLEGVFHVIGRTDADAAATADGDTIRNAVAERASTPDASMGAAADRVDVVVDGWLFRFEIEDAQRARLRDRARRVAAEHGPAVPQTLRAQLPGRVVSLAVSVGDEVALGDRLLSIEAMKMENEVRAPRSGKVEAIAVQAGQGVERGDELLRIA